MEANTYYLDMEVPENNGLIFSTSVTIIPTGKLLSPSYMGCEVTAQERILTED